MRRRSPARKAAIQHLRRFFDGHEVDVVEPPGEDVRARIDRLEIARIRPGPRIGAWTYCSIGCWDGVHDGDHGLEFLLVTPEDGPRPLTLLAMVAYYHADPDPAYRLDIGHTVPIGQPWLPGSACDHLLVSQPYPFGSELEMCRWRGGHARLLWLLPITEAEKAFRHEHDLETLEQRFDGAAIRFWDPQRPSVV